MTTIYDTYYPNISQKKIDLKNVNFSAFIVDSSYVPNQNHKKQDITGKVETLFKVLVEGDIATLSMEEIIKKIISKLEPDELEKANAFVIYDILTQELCFCETLEKNIK